MCHKVKTEILSPTPISERNQVTIAIFSSMCLFLFTPPYPNPTLAPGTCPGTELTETWGLLKKRWIGPTGFFLFLIWIWKYEAIVLAAVGCKVERPRRWGRGWRGGAWHCRFKIKQNEKREGSWWKKPYRKKKRWYQELSRRFSSCRSPLRQTEEYSYESAGTVSAQ